MKKLIISLCFFAYSFVSHSQTVDIPDSNFLAALLEEGVDTNGDGLIQNSEAEAVETLKIKEYEIGSLQGINAFKNLMFLFADENNLTSLELDLPLLFYLGCTYNELTSIDLSSLPNLEQLYCGENKLTSLNLNELPLLDRLSCGYNQLTSLDVSSLPLLSYLTCYNNDLSSLDISAHSQLKSLGCTGNNIDKLDVSSHPMLEFLLCSDNNIEIIELGSHPFLYLINCSGNKIQTLKLDSLPILKTLTCSGNNLTSIDLSGNPILQHFNCDNNYITKLELIDLPFLSNLSCSGNEVESLNINNLSNLIYLKFGNPDLEYVNMLDNNFPLIDVIGSLEGLKYLCADSLEIDFLAEEVDLSNVIINEYCPDDYNDKVNLSGMSSYGLLSDCSDGVPVSNIIELEVELESGQSFIHFPTESTYNFNIPPYNQTTIQIHNLDPELFNIEPEIYNINAIVDIDSVDFCISSSDSLVTNVCLASYTLNSPIPGFEHSYAIDFTNLGNVTANGFIRFEYDSEVMEFVESSDNWTLNSGVLELIYSDLFPLEKRTSKLTFLLNSPMDKPPLIGGENLIVNCTLFADGNDLEPLNNFTTLNETVINSFDPNDKTCLQGNLILLDSLNAPINYRIRFENTGTAVAQNIIIRDTIDTNVFDLSTLQVIRSSDPVNVSINNNMVDFQFANINLPVEDDFNDGYIIFSLNLLAELELGTKVENQASIYFDFNLPIFTNVASSELVQDTDQDGFNNLDDCDDNNSEVNPDAMEMPYNGIDDDCDEITLDDDLDQDGFIHEDDCDDTNSEINPNLIEVPYNGIDDDCDEFTFDDDLDQDGFILEDECDDTNPDINPDAEEIANNGIDEDCDGMDLVTSIHELSDSEIKIYPNPVISVINIEVLGLLIYKASLFDLNGTLISSSYNTKFIEVNSIPNGIYLLEITDLNTGKKVVEKLIVSK